MATYLIQVTFTWALLLALYELLYRSRPAFTLNRLYLLSALLAGALLPLVPITLPGSAAAATGNIAANVLQSADPVVQKATPVPGTGMAGMSWAAVAGWIYLTGALLMAVVSLRGLVYILRTAIYGSFRQVKGYRIFHSSRSVHAPFSFMGWIFIADPDQYSQQELLFVLRHEDAHNRRRHWLDVLLVQLFCVVFWFHPLVWRYRHCLKLVHEYEADRITAGSAGYDYGHFLLRQTLMKGVPPIAHSFHFSPIKNRITMLTQPRKKQIWKYSFWLPAICACLLLAARPSESDERVRVGDKTRFRGHDFYWAPNAVDSVMIEDPRTGEIIVKRLEREGGISRMDKDSVYSNDDPAVVKAHFNKNGKEIYDYANDLFHRQFPNIPDSFFTIAVHNIVIDEKGKIRYYDIQCVTDNAAFENGSTQPLIAGYIRTLGKIMDESPAWQPGKVGNKEVKVRLEGGFNVHFKPLTIMPVENIKR
ncbi:M56 family metallopeptidase [Taibaiella helva]|uniref:M56 family metallopeptidase n=1 Tax=Taibaiella helva TaxID=2301235 RepID=UPI000E57E827|nr:M56 family metallopeptidase [Taibaiella helva]